MNDNPQVRIDWQSARLVKWRGDVPEGTDPFHPQCDEIVELNLHTGERRVIFRRDDNADDE